MKTEIPRHLKMAATRVMGKIARVTNMRINVEPSGKTAQIFVPGFSFDNFDRTGNVSPNSIQRLMTAARFVAYHTPDETTGSCFLEYDKLTSDCLTFMASTRTHFHRSLYELKGTHGPGLVIETSLGYVGMSSLNTAAQLREEATGDVLVDNVNQVVAVDKKTRRPTPLADWWKEKYVDANSGAERLIVPVLPVPSQCHRLHIRVPWMEMDGYKHTNYTSYTKFCLEAAMDACNVNAFSRIKDDVLQYHVELMETAHKGETKPGDNLDVATWENAENPLKLHFDISKEGSTVLQSTFTFHEPWQ